MLRSEDYFLGVLLLSAVVVAERTAHLWRRWRVPKSIGVGIAVYLSLAILFEAALRFIES